MTTPTERPPHSQTSEALHTLVNGRLDAGTDAVVVAAEELARVPAEVLLSVAVDATAQRILSLAEDTGQNPACLAQALVAHPILWPRVTMTGRLVLVAAAELLVGQDPTGEPSKAHLTCRTWEPQAPLVVFATYARGGLLRKFSGLLPDAAGVENTVGTLAASAAQLLTLLTPAASPPPA